MSWPSTYRAWRRTVGKEPQTLECVTEQLPSSLQPHEVLIRVHAVSLNFRDVAMMKGRYPVPVIDRGVPTSDCGAEVVAIGASVTSCKVGDHVAPSYDLLNGLYGDGGEMALLGGDVDGLLREYAIYEEHTLYHLPKHLSWEEAATLTCAGTTAWNALNLPHSADNDQVALLQGTGGVSMFGLLLCLKANIRPIITSSSDEKLDIAKKVADGSSIGCVNYKTRPQWEEEARQLTGGRGVDIVVENGGETTVEQSIKAIRRRGLVSLVGFLGGSDPDKHPNMFFPILIQSATIRGINVGSKDDTQNLSNFIGKHQINLKPLISDTYQFDDANTAFEHLYAGKHIGKVIIKIT